jgi:hypothetical protein
VVAPKSAATRVSALAQKDRRGAENQERPHVYGRKR